MKLKRDGEKTDKLKKLSTGVKKEYKKLPTDTLKTQENPNKNVNTKNHKSKIEKESTGKTNKSKMKSTMAQFKPQIKSVIPKAYPSDQIVVVKNVPNKSKQIDITKAFSKFGTITYLQMASKEKAFIAFLHPEEAKSAIRAGPKILIRGRNVIVKRRNRKTKINPNDSRIVLVFRVDPNTTVDEIREHFKECGNIKSIKLIEKKLNPYYSIEFEEDASGEAALKLHNTVLKESTINVRLKSNKPAFWDMKRTIVLLNSSGLSKIDGSRITKIFDVCGEIEKCDVLCDKKRLAMLSFKHEESIPKAMRLNGKKKHGINLEIEMFSAAVEKNAVPARNIKERLNLLSKSKKSKICIEKVAEGLDEKDILNLFKTCGPVKSVTFSQERSAVVEFESSDGYCKAFSLHNYVYGGRKLILQPFSEEKLEHAKTVKEKQNLVGKTLKK